MSIKLQMVIVFGFFILLLMVIGFYMIRFSERKELKLLYAVLNIVSLIFLLVYIVFLYKQSVPIVCSIIDYILKNIQNSNLICICVVYIFGCIFLALYSSPMISILIIICSVLLKILGAIFFVFLFPIEKVYGLAHKFIHWLRNLFNSNKDK